MGLGELLGLIASIAVPLFGGIVWLVRLEGRINVLNTQQEGTEKRVDGLEEQILDRLRRIEEILISGQHR